MEPEALPESLAMNALEKPGWCREVINFMEAKTGSRMVVSSNLRPCSDGCGQLDEGCVGEPPRSQGKGDEVQTRWRL